MNEGKIKVIKKAEKDSGLTRSELSLLKVLINMYPEKAEEYLQMRKRRVFQE